MPPAPFHANELVTVHHGDCIDVLRALPDCSMDAVVTDPPYELGFMNRAWDGGGMAYRVDLWQECLRVLKPGGHVLAFGGTRTSHRLTCAIEDAGFEIRDTITWLYGSGFPKSLDVGKAIDKARAEDIEPRRAVCRQLRAALLASGKTRREIDQYFGTANVSQYWFSPDRNSQVPPVDKWPWLRNFLGIGPELDAEVWRLNGRKGTPGEAWERREVIATREVADIRNGHGRAYGGAMFAGEDTGKIEHKVTAPATEDAARWDGWGTALKPASEPIAVARKPLAGTVAANVLTHGAGALNISATRIADRWPPNVALTHADCTDGACVEQCPVEQLGEPAGFFPVFRYQAKAPSRERPKVDGVAHPTVKPLDLMRWLVRLVTPPGGTVLDPFAGSGTTVEACLAEGFRCVAIEREAEYLPLILARIERQVAPSPEREYVDLLDLLEDGAA